MSAKLTLIIPHLRTLLTHLGSAANLPELIDFNASHWQEQRNHLYHPDCQLLSLLGLPYDIDLPHAALLLHSGESNDHDDVRRWHAMVSPVYIEADKDGLLLQNTHLTLKHTESLQGELRAAAREIGLRFRPVEHPDAMGILSGDDNLEIRTTPLATVPNRRVDTILPNGKHADRLIRFMSDSQMIIAHHHLTEDMTVHSERSSKLRPNSLWIWGTGQLPAAPSRTRKATRLYTNQTGYLKLAGLLDLKSSHLPQQLPRIQPDSHVIVHIDPSEWMRFNTASAENILMNLVTNWLEPASLLAKKDEVRFFLSPCDGYIYQYHPSNLPWWKRFLPF
ncbi:MAG: hypothetical protein D6698_12595 [Gammaproteobacteria bacterium]|nr:MAG: hypothetical protein D6698_12595 [Gammaproteobacteria bacterium]